MKKDDFNEEIQNKIQELRSQQKSKLALQKSISSAKHGIRVAEQQVIMGMESRKNAFIILQANMCILKARLYNDAIKGEEKMQNALFKQHQQQQAAAFKLYKMEQQKKQITQQLEFNKAPPMLEYKEAPQSLLGFDTPQALLGFDKAPQSPLRLNKLALEGIKYTQSTRNAMFIIQFHFLTP